MIGRCGHCNKDTQSLMAHRHYETQETVIHLCRSCHTRITNCQSCALIMHVSEPNQPCAKDCFDENHVLNERINVLEAAISRRIRREKKHTIRHRFRVWWMQHQKHYYKWLDYYSGNPSLGKRLFARVLFWGMPDS